MGAAAPKPPHAIPPHSKLRGFLAFSREELLKQNFEISWTFHRINHRKIMMSDLESTV